MPGDGLFISGLIVLCGFYLLLILALVFADVWYATEHFSNVDGIWDTLNKPEIQASVVLTLVTCTISALLSIIVAVPAGYVLSRWNFRGKGIVDGILDIPIILPPLVIGLSLLILFHQVDVFGESIEAWTETGFAWLKILNEDLRPGVTFKVPAVILAQFTVSCAFAVRTMKTTFDQIDPRQEQVAMTLGCNRSRTFWSVLMPQAWRGTIAGVTLAWARALGEFGPILVFAGATRGRTEVLSTSVFLEINIGNLTGAVAISLLMIVVALAVIFLIRIIGERVWANV